MSDIKFELNLPSGEYRDLKFIKTNGHQLIDSAVLDDNGIEIKYKGTIGNGNLFNYKSSSLSSLTEVGSGELGYDKLVPDDVWSDGTNLYYSHRYNTSRRSDFKRVGGTDYPIWQNTQWNIDIYGGRYIWECDGHIYYSRFDDQYELDKSTMTWVEKEWIGILDPDKVGTYIWKDGDNIYYSHSQYQYVLDKSSNIWLPKTWNGVNQPSGLYIWYFNNDVYLTNRFGSEYKQCKLNRATDTWEIYDGFTMKTIDGTIIPFSMFDYFEKPIYYKNAIIAVVRDNVNNRGIISTLNNNGTWIPLTDEIPLNDDVVGILWSDGEHLFETGTVTYQTPPKITKKFIFQDAQEFGTSFTNVGESNSKIVYKYDNAQEDISTNILSNNIYNLDISTIDEDRYVVKDNSIIYTNTGSSIKGNIFSSVMLFNGLQDSEIYTIDIYNIDGILVRQLIPKERQSDFAIGLYDNVNGKFYENLGSEPFINGGYMNQYVIDKYNGLKSLQTQSQSTQDAKQITYGILGNTGSATIVDIDGRIEKMIKNDDLPYSSVNTNIYANGNQVQNHISNDSKYDINNKIFDIDLTNGVNAMDVQYNGLLVQSDISLYNVLVEVLSEKFDAGEIDDMLSQEINYGDDNQFGTIKEYLMNITIPYGYIEKSNYLDAIDQICELAQLYCYYKDNGKLCFTSARPIMNGSEDINVIPAKNQFSEFDIDLIIKNKYNNIFIPENIVEHSIDTISENGVKAYNISSYSTTFSDYENIIGSKAYNSTITSLKDDILSEFYGYHYAIIKYDIPLTSQIPTKLKFNIENSYTSWDSTTRVETTISNIETNPIITTQTDDNSVISYWLYGDKVKDRFENLIHDFQIKINQNNTITLYVLLKISNGSSDSDTVSIVYNTHSFNVLFDVYSNKYTEKDGNYQLEFKNNSLLQQDTLYKTTRLAVIMKDNILSDYENGVRTARITIGCADYYSTDGEKLKDWANGEIIEVGDIVRIDNDNSGTSRVKDNQGNDVYFRVTGRTFRYSGVPLIDLELQEIV